RLQDVGLALPQHLGAATVTTGRLALQLYRHFRGAFAVAECAIAEEHRQVLARRVGQAVVHEDRLAQVGGQNDSALGVAQILDQVLLDHLVHDHRVHANGAELVSRIAGGESGILECFSTDAGTGVNHHVSIVVRDVGGDDAAGGAQGVALPLAGPVGAEAVADVLHGLAVRQLSSQVSHAVAFVQVQHAGSHARLAGLADFTQVIRVVVGDVGRLVSVQILPVGHLGSALAAIGNGVQYRQAGDDAGVIYGGLLRAVNRL